MPDLQNVDAVNSLKRKSVPYDKYFGEMNLSEEETRKRIQFSESLEDVMLYIFALISIMQEYEQINESLIIEQIKIMYADIVSEYMEIDDYLDGYINDFAESTTETTLKNLAVAFFLSLDRAVLISENESNSIFNYQNFLDAVLSGKTMKRWVDVRDSRERKSHLKVGGTTLPIMRPFVVGKGLMLFPRDTSLGASMEEISNCRCRIEYF